MTSISELFEAQDTLQHDSFKKVPSQLTGEDRADFILWNAYALIDEISEAMQEVKWKPWLTDGSRGTWVDRDAFVDELVDAFHFLMNMALTAGCSGEEFAGRYFTKRAVNARRQAEGYGGEKDADGRAIDIHPKLTPLQHEHLRRQAKT